MYFSPSPNDRPAWEYPPIDGHGKWTFSISLTDHRKNRISLLWRQFFFKEDSRIFQWEHHGRSLSKCCLLFVSGKVSLL
jgi:hypothetical protein